MAPILYRLKAPPFQCPRKSLSPDQPFNITDLTFYNATTLCLFRGENLVKPQIGGQIVG